MPQQCGLCPALQAQIETLHQLIAQLRQQIALLRLLLGVAMAGIAGTLGLIDRELTEPTMPRRQLIPAVYQRLSATCEQIEAGTP
jgi:hypothetical protein